MSNPYYSQRWIAACNEMDLLDGIYCMFIFLSLNKYLYFNIDHTIPYFRHNLKRGYFTLVGISGVSILNKGLCFERNIFQCLAFIHFFHHWEKFNGTGSHDVILWYVMSICSISTSEEFVLMFQSAFPVIQEF